MMLAILMIVVGAIKMRECTVEPKIPPFLIGESSLVKSLSSGVGLLGLDRCWLARGGLLRQDDDGRQLRDRAQQTCLRPRL